MPGIIAGVAGIASRANGGMILRQGSSESLLSSRGYFVFFSLSLVQELWLTLLVLYDDDAGAPVGDALAMDRVYCRSVLYFFYRAIQLRVVVHWSGVGGSPSLDPRNIKPPPEGPHVLNVCYMFALRIFFFVKSVLCFCGC